MQKCCHTLMDTGFLAENSHKGKGLSDSTYGTFGGLRHSSLHISDSRANTHPGVL